ncbi:MAG: ABC transporter substrate-binding protein [Acidimicrobiales bacterium]
MRGPLTGVCPATIVVQTDWTPEADHSELYQLTTPTGTVDADRKRYTSELVAHGVDTGVKIEIRAGGPAIGFQQVSAQMYADPAIYLGYVNTDEAIQDSARQATVAVVAPRNLDPQIIMWDPASHPQFHTISDIGKTNTTVVYLKGRTYMDYLVRHGILKASQIDGSYDGAPARFVASGGEIAQQGFATAEPYVYEHEIAQWMKPVSYQLIADTGYSPYPEALAVRADALGADDACLRRLVPMIQGAQADYVANPAAANATIVRLTAAYRTGTAYTAGVAAYAAKAQVDQKIIANGSDGVLGSFDPTRIDDLEKIVAPIYGTRPGVVFTNQFLDRTIHLPG